MPSEVEGIGTEGAVSPNLEVVICPSAGVANSTGDSARICVKYMEQMPSLKRSEDIIMKNCNLGLRMQVIYPSKYLKLRIVLFGMDRDSSPLLSSGT